MAVVQRFGGAMNLNVHLHALVIDGMFARDGAGLRFWPATVLQDLDSPEVCPPVVQLAPCVDFLLAPSVETAIISPVLCGRGGGAALPNPARHSPKKLHETPKESRGRGSRRCRG